MVEGAASAKEDHAALAYTLEQVLEAATVLLRATQQYDDSHHDMCHPTSHNFEPYVPHCRDYYNEPDDDDDLNEFDSSRTIMRSLLSSSFDHSSIDWEFYLTNVGGAMLCIAAVALIAGLFLGYLTLDAFDLRIVERASLDFEEREYARTILPIVVERHRVLVTLLILNGLAYETCEFCWALYMLVFPWLACFVCRMFVNGFTLVLFMFSLSF